MSDLGCGCIIFGALVVGIFHFMLGRKSNKVGVE